MLAFTCRVLTSRVSLFVFLGCSSSFPRRVECSSNGNNCIYSPADVRVVCQDGSITAAPTPAPATASTCAVVELSGTIDEKWDGFYQAQTDENGDSSIFVGYDVTNGGATVTA